MFLPIGLRFSLSNWRRMTILSPGASLLTYQSSSIPTNQDSAFRTNQTVKFEVPICVKMDQLGISGGDFCLHKSAPRILAGHRIFPCPRGLCFLGWG